jgi:hypothetical protein
MTMTYIGTHAVDVGGQVVEPGQPIPGDADPQIVRRLERDGFVQTNPKRPSKSSGTSASEE